MSGKLTGLPLEGVRVLDLSWIIAGPTATRFLAMMGAEVIKVGSARRPDPSTRGAPFQAYNQSKLYAALNISRPEGLELAMRLASVSDIAIENFAAGVIERLGLGYDALKQVKPRHHHALLVRHGALGSGQGLCGLWQPAAILHGLERHIGLP